jgi:hypothetical protein
MILSTMVSLIEIECVLGIKRDECMYIFMNVYVYTVFLEKTQHV